MDKYYTPEESDLYVGYVCEVKEDKNWKPILVTWSDIFEDRFIYALEREEVRTKYLTQEDIESLGWIQHATMPGVFFREDNPLGILYLELCDNNIIRIENDRTSEYLFQGKAKSINELKKILEWIL